MDKNENFINNKKICKYIQCINVHFFKKGVFMEKRGIGKTNMIIIAIVITLYAILMAINVTGEEQSYTLSTDVTGCQTLSSSGSYILTTNITSNGTCIIIGANDILLDGNGTIITGNTTGYGINNTGGYDNITIKNFAGIKNFSIGIYSSGMQNGTIYNNTIGLVGGDGVYLTGTSQYNNISNNRINITAPTSYTINFNNASHNTLRGNTLIANASSSSAYYFSTGINNTVTNDILAITTGADIQIGNGQGILTNLTSFNKNDTLFDTGATGNITVQWYTTINATNRSTQFQNANITIIDNTGTIEKTGTTDTTGTSILATTEFIQTNNSKVYKTPHTINVTSPTTNEIFSKNSTVNITTTNSTTIAFTFYSCGNVNSTYTNTLLHNIVVKGTCFTINQNNAVLEGAGYTIRGNTSGIGIDNTGGYDNVTIRNFGGINNYSSGISMTDIENSTMSNNTLSTNTIAVGIGGTEGRYNTITGNTITMSGTSGHGIEMSADNPTIINNSITTTGTGGYGVSIGDGLTTGLIQNGLINAINANDINHWAIATAGSITVRNVSFNKNDINITDSSPGTIIVQWYLDITTKNDTGVLTSANVTITNSSNMIVNSQLTASNGRTTTIPLTEFTQNKTGKTYATPHTINTTATGYTARSITLNITTTNSTTRTIGMQNCGGLWNNTTLTQNVTTIFGTCYTIETPNIIIDGAGYTITGNESGNGIDNTRGYNNITIKNFGGIKNFTNGITYTQATSGTITNNTINTNVTYGKGVELITSLANTISYNTITTTGESSSTITLMTSNNNNIQSNTLTTSGPTGDVLSSQDSNNTLITTNTMRATGGGRGAWISESHNTTFISDTVIINGTNTDGLIFYYSNNGRIQSTTINATGTGIQLSAINTTITGSTIRTTDTTTG